MKTCAFTGHRPKGLGYPESDERCGHVRGGNRAGIKEAVHAGLSAKTEPIYGAGGLERRSQWNGTDGVVCQRNWEAGLDYSVGYP